MNSTTLAPMTWGTKVLGSVSDVEAYERFMIQETYDRNILKSRPDIPQVLQDFLFSGLFKSVGKGGFKNPTQVIFETDPVTMTIKFKAHAAPALGASVALTVSADDHSPDGLSKFMEGSMVVFPGNIVGKMVSHTGTPGADVITIARYGGGNLPAVAEGTVMPITSGYSQELDVAPTWIPSRNLRCFTFGKQKIKEATEVTAEYIQHDQLGTFNVQAMDIPIPFKNGTVRAWSSMLLTEWNKGVWQKFMNNIMFMQESDTAQTLAQGSTNMGLLPWLLNGAQQLIAPPPGGTLTVADLQLIATAFDNAGFGDTNHVMKLGKGIYNPLNDLILSLGQQDTRQGTMNRYYELEYSGIKGVNGNHNFSYGLIPEFSNPFSGYQDMGFEYLGIIMPDGTTSPGALRGDLLGGGSVPLFEISYESAWDSTVPGIGDGMWRTVVSKGPRFCGEGESPQFRDDKLIIDKQCTYRQVMLQPGRWALWA